MQEETPEAVRKDELEGPAAPARTPAHQALYATAAYQACIDRAVTKACDRLVLGVERVTTNTPWSRYYGKVNA